MTYCKKVGLPKCTKTHGLCYLGWPCPYCAKKVIKVEKNENKN